MKNAEERRDIFKSDLLKKRQIYLEGEIEYEMAKEASKMIIWLNAQSDKEITLYINSFGGSVSAGLALYDVIKNSAAPITGIVCPFANSMALVVLQACRTRKAMPHSIIRLHNNRIRLHAEWDKIEQELKEELEKVKRGQEEVWQILAERSGKEKEWIKKICQSKLELTAQEAKEAGLIDKIV